MSPWNSGRGTTVSPRNLDLGTTLGLVDFVIAQFAIQEVEYFTPDARGCGFKPHRKLCIVSFSKTLYPLLSTGSTWEYPSRHYWKIFDWYVKNQNKQKKTTEFKRLSSILFCFRLVWERRPWKRQLEWSLRSTTLSLH